MNSDKLKQQKKNYYNKNKEDINKRRREQYVIANNSVKGVHQLPLTNDPNYSKYYTYQEDLKFDDYLQAVNNTSFERASEFSTTKSKIYVPKFTESQQRDPYSLNVRDLKPNEGDRINTPFGIAKFYKEKPTEWSLKGHTFSYNTDFKPNKNSGLFEGI
jgi:hypothetical protein